MGTVRPEARVKRSKVRVAMSQPPKQTVPNFYALDLGGHFAIMLLTLAIGVLACRVNSLQLGATV